MIGRVVGKYKLVAQIGEGGTGVVWRAKHVVHGGPAAIKILLPQVIRDQVVVDRFFAEVKTACTIRHPGVVAIFDFGRDGEDTYIAMELLRGESLQAFLDRNERLSPELAAQIATQMFSALDAMHLHAIVHRDLKPDKVFLVRGRSAPGSIGVKLLDFGIAKLRSTTTVLGTPAYMAPEQCRGDGGPIDARADLYAVGCILFQMLTGRPPFLAQGNRELIAMHLAEPPPRLSSLAPKLPVELDALLAKLLIKDPNDRIPSAAFALAALERASIETLYIEIPLVDGSEVAADDDGGPRCAWLLPLVVLVVALVVAGGAVWWIGFRSLVR